MVIFRSRLGLGLGYHHCFWFGCFLIPLSQPELKNWPMCPKSEGILQVQFSASKDRHFSGFIFPERELLPAWRQMS